jgi:hypothetical protein
MVLQKALKTAHGNHAGQGPALERHRPVVGPEREQKRFGLKRLGGASRRVGNLHVIEYPDDGGAWNMLNFVTQGIRFIKKAFPQPIGFKRQGERRRVHVSGGRFVNLAARTGIFIQDNRLDPSPGEFHRRSETAWTCADNDRPALIHEFSMTDFRSSERSCSLNGISHPFGRDGCAAFHSLTDKNHARADQAFSFEMDQAIYTDAHAAKHSAGGVFNFGPPESPATPGHQSGKKGFPLEGFKRLSVHREGYAPPIGFAENSLGIPGTRVHVFSIHIRTQPFKWHRQFFLCVRDISS